MKSKYRGVKYDSQGNRTAPWKVQLKAGPRVLSIFMHEEEVVAAWAADLVRYARYGTDIAKWPGNVVKPNFGPCVLDDVDRQPIVDKMIKYAIVPLAILERHLREYDDLAKIIEQNRTAAKGRAT